MIFGRPRRPAGPSRLQRSGGQAHVSAALVFGVFLVPIGPATRVSGVIEGFGLSESELGSYPTATIRLSDREITQSLPRSNRCVIGERISLWRQRRVLGQVFVPELNSCASGD